MEFTLLYAGPLHSGGSATPRNEKHSIRKVFHSQLRRLWTVHPNLRENAEDNGGIGLSGEQINALPKEELFERGVRHIAGNWNRNGYNFLPLVTKKLILRCRLDILFLRTDEYPFVVHGGDIDGRLKILFDAFRMIDNGNELPTGAKPESTEDPFFVLLEDDKLISEVHVTTDRLLKLPDDKPVENHDVFLQIGVKLNTTVKVAHSWIFE